MNRKRGRTAYSDEFRREAVLAHARLSRTARSGCACVTSADRRVTRLTSPSPSAMQPHHRSHPPPTGQRTTEPRRQALTRAAA